jgi:hypothetical protein
MTTTITLSDEQALLLFDIMGNAAYAFEDGLEGRLERDEYDNNEDLAADHAKLEAIRQFSTELMNQLLPGDGDLEKKILEALSTREPQRPDELVKSCRAVWSKLAPALKDLEERKLVHDGTLGYTRVV